MNQRLIYTKKLSFKLKLFSMFLNQAIVFWHCDRYCGSLIVYSMTICVLGKSKSEIRQAINQNRSTYTVFFLCLLHAQLNSSPSQSSKLSDGGRANCYVRFLHNYLKHKQTIEKGENLFKKYFTKLFFFFCNPLFELYSSCNFRGQMLQITSDFCLGSIISFCN